MNRLFVLLIISALFFISACQKEKIEVYYEEYHTGTDNQLWSVFFVNEDTGYVSGGSRYVGADILQTIDGGKTWTEQDASTIGFTAFDITFLNKDVGFATAHINKLVKTTNGGEDWSLIQLGFLDNNNLSEPPEGVQMDWMPLRKIHFVNDSTGYIVGGLGYIRGFVFRTTDSGQTWLYHFFEREFRDVYFTDEQTGYMCGYGAVYKTTNGGDAWFPLDIKGDFFIALHFPTPSSGYAVGNSGMIIKTINQGHSWTTLRKAAPATKRIEFEDVYFKDELTGYAVGKNTVMKTVDGGNKWIVLNNLPKHHYTSIHFVNDHTFYLSAFGGFVVKVIEE